MYAQHFQELAELKHGDESMYDYMRENSELYRKKNEALYSILRKKCATGSALTFVKDHKSTLNGGRVWMDLKRYYGQEGNKSLYGENAL